MKLKGKFKKWSDSLKLKYGNLNEEIEIDWINLQPYPDAKLKTVPKIVWLYWDSQEPNLLVKLCIKNLIKKLPDYEVNVLNKTNIYDYIKDLPKLNETLPIANLTDYYRLKLLSLYGGIWVDASILINENFDWFLNKITNHDAFLFYSDHCTLNYELPVTESWLIAAPKESAFISDWLKEFSACIFSDDPKGYYRYLHSNKHLLQNLPNLEYLIVYISAIVVTDRKKYNLLYANSGAVGHYYNYKYLCEYHLIPYILMRKPAKKVFLPKLIKFTKDSRSSVEAQLKLGNINPFSVIGRVIKDS